MAREMIAEISARIGRIEPWREQTLWADLSDPLGRSLGRLSVHTVPNGQASRVDVLLHGVSRNVASMVRRVALCDAGGAQVTGAWQTHSDCCRFTVPRDRSVTVQVAVAEGAPPGDQERAVRSRTLDELERLQESLETEGRRKGKRRK